MELVNLGGSVRLDHSRPSIFDQRIWRRSGANQVLMAELVEEIKGLGGDLVFVDSPELVPRSDQLNLDQDPDPCQSRLQNK
jgi:hypothetical protein